MGNFKGKTKKLMSMSKEEIFFRLKEKIIQQQECIEYLKNTKFKRICLSERIFTKREGTVTSRTLTERSEYSGKSQFFTDLYIREKRIELIKGHHNIDEWLNKANRILCGRLLLLGQEVIIPDRIDWHRDPIMNIQWPRTFYINVNKHTMVKDGDIKDIWELNRHQYLIVLGKAYWLTKVEKYASKAIEIIVDWIKQNPLNCGVNWASSLELAVRCLSWIWTLNFCRGAKSITPEARSLIEYSVIQQAKYIEKHLSFYSSPYNHLVGEAAALHVIGNVFHYLETASKWDDLGWRILEQQVCKQFHPDGMCVEQSMFYHHFTLGFYLQSIMLRKINSKSVCQDVMDRIEKALEFAMYMQKPDGTLPMIGDIDNARSLYFTGKHSWDFRGFLSLGAVLFHRPDFKYCSNGFSEEMLWMCSDSEIYEFETMTAKPPALTSVPFYKSGYYVSRDKWDPKANYMFFDCGEISDGLYGNEIVSAAHGHADTLSLELSVSGQQILVDGGFYTYFGDEEWHRHFRMEEAHNISYMENYRQANYSGRLKWNNVRASKLLCWVSNETFDSMSGVIKHTKNLIQQRDIVNIKGKFIFINDLIKGNDEDIEMHLNFNFHPSVNVIFDENNRQIVAFIGEGGVLLKFFANVSIRGYRGGCLPSKGWTAYGYGFKEKSWRINLSGRLAKGGGMLPTVLIYFKDEPTNYKFDIEKINIDGTLVTTINFSRDSEKFTIIMRKNGNTDILSNGVSLLKNI